MELVPLSTRVLDHLAKDDIGLKRFFQGVYASDELPQPPPVASRARRGYIVNTDPSSEPGQHWLAMWTEGNACEVFDSYGLPLELYTNDDLEPWWMKHKFLTRSDQSLQALGSQTCGHYCLMYLKAKARGIPTPQFLARWGVNLVQNDRRVAEEITKLIKADFVDGACSGQCNVSKEAFMNCNGIDPCYRH